MGEEAVRQKRRGRRHRPLALLLLAVPLLLTSFVGAFRPPATPATRLARLSAGVRIGNGRLQGRCIRPLASSLTMDPPSDDGDGVGGGVAAAVDESKQQRQAEEHQVVPSLGALLRFTIPTLGIWLAGPIMSLVRAFG